jgi:hypothetical protein
MKKFRTVVAIGALTMLIVPAVASAGTVLKAQMTLTQITPSTDANGNLVTLVNGLVEVKNLGTEPTQGLAVTSEVSVPLLGSTYDLGLSGDLLYAPSLAPGETRCYGIGGYLPYAPNMAYVLTAHVGASNSRFGVRTLADGAFFDEDTGMDGHSILPASFDCP